MANNKQADAAPATPAPADVLTDEQRKKQLEDSRIKPVVAPPPPAPGMEATKSLNDRGAWLAESESAWFVSAAADTKAAVLAEISSAIISRFNADTALAAGKAVTGAWIDGQILTYQMPITEDDIRQAVISKFGESGVQVQG